MPTQNYITDRTTPCLKSWLMAVSVIKENIVISLVLIRAGSLTTNGNSKLLVELTMSVSIVFALYRCFIFPYLDYVTKHAPLDNTFRLRAIIYQVHVFCCRRAGQERIFVKGDPPNT